VLIFSRNLRIRSLLLTKSSQALTREGLTRITTEDLTGSVFVEDKENARLRDVILLYAGALFAAGITIGTDGIADLIRFALRSERSDATHRRQTLLETSDSRTTVRNAFGGPAKTHLSLD